MTYEYYLATADGLFWQWMKDEIGSDEFILKMDNLKSAWNTEGEDD